MVIINQIKDNNGWEYIGSDIGIAIACVMKSGKKRDITWDEDDQVYAPRALNTNKNHLMMATNTNSKLLEALTKGAGQINIYWDQLGWGSNSHNRSLVVWRSLLTHQPWFNSEVNPFRSQPKFSLDQQWEVLKKYIKERSNCVVEAR